MNADSRNDLPYRPCVGIVLINSARLIFAGQRIDNPGPAWQMPQGGIEDGENTRDAALRELREETGIAAENVEIVAESRHWIDYDLPIELVDKLWRGRFRGQKQKWFVMRFSGADSQINIATTPAEFSRWKWMTGADLVESVVPFKRHVYTRVLAEFDQFL